MKLMVTILIYMSVMFPTQCQIQSLSSGNWNNASTWVGNVVPNLESDDVEIINGHSITISADVTIRNITVTNGNLIIGPNKLKIYGIIQGAQKNNVSSNSSSVIELLGTESTPQFEFPLNIQKLNKLIINRNSGATSNHDLDLDDGVPADGIVLQLISGIIYMTNGSILYLNSKQIQADIPGSDSSHVDGIVQRNIPKDSGVYTFPVGNKGHFRPFGIGLQNGNSDNINQVEFIYDTPINNTDINYNNLPGGIMQFFYWKHTIISGGNPQRRLSYSEKDFPNVTSQERVNSMTLANTDGTASWDKATTPWTVNDSSKWVQFDNANASNSTYWTLGSVLSNVSYDDIDLPISFVDFSASIIDNSLVELTWITAHEYNSNYFVLCRSTNGVDFISIDTVAAVGFSNVFTYYESIDKIQGTATIYYKLLQYDFDGKKFESHIIEVYLPQNYADFAITSYPLNQAIYIQIVQNESKKNRLTICDTKGNVYYESNVVNESQELYIPILESGIYIVTIKTQKTIISNKLFVP